MQSLQEILAKKNLDLQLFEKNVGMTAEMPIDLHVAWVFNNIYSKPYPQAGKPTDIARPIHGMQHVTRAAINIPIFANLFRRYGDVQALALNDEDIKLLQIAALFHDSARENEKVDHWDKESALFFYHYATKILQVDPLKAKLLAEAIANKDAEGNNYYELLEMTWVKRKDEAPKNIYQKLIHDSDCLEIVRARDHFDATFLDFYKDIASSNEDAFEMMAKLITEARSLIAAQGDSRNRINLSLKLQYEHPNAYRDIMAFITQQAQLYPLLMALSHNQLLIGDALHQPLLRSFSPEASPCVTEKSLTQAMHSGQLFARSVGSPAAFYVDRKKEDEYTAQLEIRKMTRVPGQPTRTTKPNNLEKFGNPNRSVSMISSGAGIYASQGFLILNPNIDHVGTVSCTDADTGRGKKSDIIAPESTREKKEAQLKALHRQLKMGGSSRRFWHSRPTTHNEILYRITQVNAIYFTQDPAPHNDIVYGKDAPCNPHTHYLQALFLQTEYQKATGITLPIFEYSGVHHFIKAAPIYTEDQIVAMWVSMVFELIEKSLKSKGYFTESLETLKIKAIDGYTIDGYTFGHKLIKKQTALDLNYSPQLREKIDIALAEEKSKCLFQHNQNLMTGIRDGHLSVLSHNVFMSLITSPHLLVGLRDQINSECLQFFFMEFKDPKAYYLKNSSKYDINNTPSINNYFCDDLGKVYFFARLFNRELCEQIEIQIDILILDDFKILSADILNEKYRSCFISPLDSLLRNLTTFDRFNEYKDRLTSLIIDITEHLNKRNDIYCFQLTQSIIGDTGFLDGEIKEQCNKIMREFLDKPDGSLNRKKYIKDYKVPEETFFLFSKKIYKELTCNLVSYGLTERELLISTRESLVVEMKDDNPASVIVSPDESEPLALASGCPLPDGLLSASENKVLLAEAACAAGFFASPKQVPDQVVPNERNSLETKCLPQCILC